MKQIKGLEITTEAAAAVIETSAAKTFLRVDGSSEDTLIALWVTAATKQVENYLKRSLINRTYRLTLDRFDDTGFDADERYGPGMHDLPSSLLTAQDHIYLPRPPIVSITSVTTYDTANASSTFAAASYGFDAVNGRLYLNQGYVWPTSLRDYNAIQVVYVAGYGSAASSIPAPIVQAVYNQLMRIYEQRGECGDLSEAVKCDLAGYRLGDYLGFY